MNKKYSELRAELLKIIREENLNLAEVNLTKCQSILDKIENKFVQKRNLQWWWEALKGEKLTVQFQEKAYKYFHQLIPREEIVWFLASDDNKLWLFEGTIDSIQKVIDETYFFEYFIVSKKLEWLLCENHHGVLSCVGEKMIGKMNALLLEKQRKNERP